MLSGRSSATAGLLVPLALASCLPPPTAAADRIVLRNLDVITDKVVAEFDEGGVRFQDGATLAWDQIERGTVAPDQQSRFDQLLAELGSHLYRIRQRLQTGDYPGLLPHAEAVYGRYQGRRDAAAFMVFQSLVWSRLAAGQREAALEPHLRCLECLRADATLADTLPGSRRPRVDVTTGLTLDLVPVWFDGEAARQALTPVGNVIASMEKPHAAGTRIYFATLALAAGEPQKAEQALSGLQGLTPLRGIVDAQSALQRGDADKAARDLSLRLPDLDRQDRPLALYWLGLARLTGGNAGNRQEGLLNLLEIPALFADQQPELAAAGLYEAMREMARAGDAKGGIAVRRELLDRYGQTWHAAKTRADDEKAKN